MGLPMLLYKEGLLEVFALISIQVMLEATSPILALITSKVILLTSGIFS